MESPGNQILTVLKYPRPFVPHDTRCVAHYTKLCNLPNILKKEGICLWATRFSHFEDKKEFEWARQVLEKYLPGLAKSKGIEYDPSDKVFPYILSLTNSIDDEYMWRHYGDDNKGVMLIFDRLEIYSHCNDHIENTGEFRTCMNVEYANDSNIEQVIDNTFNNLEKDFSNANSYETFIELPAYIKDQKNFEKENEFRVTHYSYNSFTASSNLEFAEFEYAPDYLKFRNSNGILIPYIELLLPHRSLVGIVLGEKCENEKNYKAIELLLRSKGYSAGIFKTRISNNNNN